MVYQSETDEVKLQYHSASVNVLHFKLIPVKTEIGLHTLDDKATGMANVYEHFLVCVLH